MYMMFVQAGLDRHKRVGVGEVITEFIKKLNRIVHILLTHPIRYGK